MKVENYSKDEATCKAMFRISKFMILKEKHKHDSWSDGCLLYIADEYAEKYWDEFWELYLNPWEGDDASM